MAVAEVRLVSSEKLVRGVIGVKSKALGLVWRSCADKCDRRIGSEKHKLEVLVGRCILRMTAFSVWFESNVSQPRQILSGCCTV